MIKNTVINQIILSLLVGFFKSHQIGNWLVQCIDAQEGGPWGFGQILLRVVLGVFRKSRGGGPLFLPFFVFHCIFM